MLEVHMSIRAPQRKCQNDRFFKIGIPHPFHIFIPAQWRVFIVKNGTSNTKPYLCIQKMYEPLSQHWIIFFQFLLMENFPGFYIFNTLIFMLNMKLSLAADTITPTTFICDGEKLVWSSQRFELGFFSPGNSKNSKYIGIWYKKSPDTVVWVANRNTPIHDPQGILAISSNGNLVLLNQTNGTIWSSNMSRQIKNPVAKLLDTGNVVLRDNFSSNTCEGNYMWQSFDYPSDTLLSGMKVGWNLKTGQEW